MFNDTIIKERT